MAKRPALPAELPSEKWKAKFGPLRYAVIFSDGNGHSVTTFASKHRAFRHAEALMRNGQSPLVYEVCDPADDKTS